MQAAADEVGRVEPGKASISSTNSMAKLEKMGVKFVKDVDKSGFIKIAEPIQDKIAERLGPHASRSHRAEAASASVEGS